MADALRSLYEVVCDRRENKQEGSYTCYLFEQGMDKILKKVAEEAGETIIAAKNGDNRFTAEEICDLFYHVCVLMVEAGIPYDQVQDILNTRAQKIGNLKQFHVSDHNT